MVYTRARASNWGLLRGWLLPLLDERSCAGTFRNRVEDHFRIVYARIILEKITVRFLHVTCAQVVLVQ